MRILSFWYSKTAAYSQKYGSNNLVWIDGKWRTYTECSSSFPVCRFDDYVYLGIGSAIEHWVENWRDYLPEGDALYVYNGKTKTIKICFNTGETCTIERKVGDKKMTEKPKLNLINEPGDAFSILKRAKESHVSSGLPKEKWIEILGEATSKDYHHLIKTMIKHFDIRQLKED